MILRRLTAHVIAQNWFAVFLDFAIVVVGVFFGIQVSNWNEARLTDRQAATFAERLRADLREEAWVYDYHIEYYDDVLANAERALAALEGTSTASGEALLVAAYRASQYTQPYRRRATYDELISTGAIGLIRDRTLRDAATRIYTTAMNDNIAKEGLESRYREAFRMTVPIAAQRALRASCGDRHVARGDYRGIVDSLDYDCVTGLSPQMLAEAAGALRAEASLVPLLRLRISDVETRLGDLTVVNNDLLTTLRALAGEKS